MPPARPRRGRTGSAVRARTHDDKRQRIARALDRSDAVELRRLALSPGGLVDEASRRQAWPRLLGIDTNSVPDHRGLIQEHRQQTQIALDVHRSLWRFPVGIRTSRRLQLRKQLAGILDALFNEYPDLHYYQGLHEIAAVLMLNTNTRVGYAMLARLAACHIRDHLGDSMAPTLAQLQLMMTIVRVVDRELFDFMQRAEVMTTFALSWPLTWFCHVIDNLQDVSRVFDVCLASHPFTVLYISAAVIVSRRDAVLGGQCSMDVVYHTLCQLPPERSVEQLVALGLQYQRAHPLYSLLYLPSLSTAEVQMLAKCHAVMRYDDFLRQTKPPPSDSAVFRGYASRATVSRPIAMAVAYVLAAAVWGVSMTMW